MRFQVTLHDGSVHVEEADRAERVSGGGGALSTVYLWLDGDPAVGDADPAPPSTIWENVTDIVVLEDEDV